MSIYSSNNNEKKTNSNWSKKVRFASAYNFKIKQNKIEKNARAGSADVCSSRVWQTVGMCVFVCFFWLLSFPESCCAPHRTNLLGQSNNEKMIILGNASEMQLN